MAQMKLTKKAVEALAKAGAEAEIYDTEQRGLVLRVRSGGRLVWTVILTAGGKRQRITLKGSDSLDLDTARAAARRLRVSVDDGKLDVGSAAEDASKSAREAAGVVTLRALIDAYFEAGKAARSADIVRARIKKHLPASLLDKPAAEVSRLDVAPLLGKIAAGTESRKAAPSSANRLGDDLKAVLSWGVDQGYFESNALSRMKKAAAVRARERVLTMEEAGQLLRRLPGSPMSEAVRRIVFLLAHTACRASEIAELRRAEVDLKAAVLRLPGARVKNERAFVVPLVATAVEVLTAAMAVSEHSEFVFPSPKDWREPIDGHAVATAVRRSQEYIGLAQWTAHDLRRTAATELSRRGVQPHIIEVMLNHTPPGVTRRHYNLAAYEAEHRDALDKWAELLKAAQAKAAKQSKEVETNEV